VTYASKISSEECRIDWNAGAQDISLTIRAFSPHPGSYSLLRGKRLKIIKARAIPRTREAVPGSVITATGERLEVACGEGSLLIDELQVEGKKIANCQDFLRGNWISPGEILGTSLFE
jgi:methionyl-tRNA formyltransferase